jgi:hypothetical protein
MIYIYGVCKEDMLANKITIVNLFVKSANSHHQNIHLIIYAPYFGAD